MNYSQTLLYTSFNYIQAPSIIISKINKTSTIAADEPHDPQLPITHSSFFSIHIILWKKWKNVSDNS